jgi:hypothetical protein
LVILAAPKDLHISSLYQICKLCGCVCLKLSLASNISQYLFSSACWSTHLTNPNCVSTMLIMSSTAPAAMSRWKISCTRGTDYPFSSPAHPSLSEPRLPCGISARTTLCFSARLAQSRRKQAPWRHKHRWPGFESAKQESWSSSDSGMSEGPVSLYFYTRYSWMHQDPGVYLRLTVARRCSVQACRSECWWRMPRVGFQGKGYILQPKRKNADVIQSSWPMSFVRHGPRPSSLRSGKRKKEGG